jgi:hypothetical protein
MSGAKKGKKAGDKFKITKEQSIKEIIYIESSFFNFRDTDKDEIENLRSPGIGQSEFGNRGEQAYFLPLNQ